MRVRNSFILLFLCRIYVLIALAVALVVSPPLYVPIPLLSLLLYLYLEFKTSRTQLMIPFNLFLALCLPLLLGPLVGVWWSHLFTIPVIPLLDYSLRRTALSYHFGPAKDGHRPTRLCLSLCLSVLAVGIVSLVLGSWNVLISCFLVGGYLAVVIALVLWWGSAAPSEAMVVSHKVLAGKLIKVPIRLMNRSQLGGQLFLVSTYSWFQIRPDRLLLDKPTLEVDAAFTPPLAGPMTVAVRASFMDPWALIHLGFSLEILRLFIIPRARYAEWLARKYLKVSHWGSCEAMTSATPISQRASRRGTEFYGLRPYQPGDSAKIIDWKHSLKLQQVIVKEFLDTGVEHAILAVNLSVSDEEEQDKLIYTLITTALTLAKENIPSISVAYNSQKVVLSTRLLAPKQALLQAFSLSQEISVSPSPFRYLGVPDVTRLRANIHRLGQARQPAAMILAELFQLEYAALKEAAQCHPATTALAAALGNAKSKANVIIMSCRNHDAAALAFNQYALQEKGYRVIPLKLGKLDEKVPSHLLS